MQHTLFSRTAFSIKFSRNNFFTRILSLSRPLSFFFHHYDVFCPKKYGFVPENTEEKGEGSAHEVGAERVPATRCRTETPKVDEGYRSL